MDIATVKAMKESYQPGNYVTFGNYPQGENCEVQPIEWLVLEVQGDQALLISRYALDCRQYNTIGADVTWETCSLRTWLNSTFINEAFNASEQMAILITTVDNSESEFNSEWSVSEGNDTQDRVFLLSYAEAEKYFASSNARTCAPTDYALKQGAATESSYEVDGRTTARWWLRSPGSAASLAALVYFNGSLGSCDSVNNIHGGVRPAFWLDLTYVIY